MPKKYIDANKIQWHSNWLISGDKRIYACLDEIDNIPAADVEEVRHGYWIERGIYSFKCSACGEVEKYESPYCRWCGAKMDGKE